MEKYILFDIDDTLLYTSENAYLKHLRICKHLWIENTNRKEYFRYYGNKTITEMAEILIPNISSDKYLLLYEEAGKCIAYKPIYPNLISIFELLGKKGYQIWILTNWTKKKTDKKINILGIRPYCKYIFHGENVTSKKPSPHVFDKLFSLIDVHNSKIIFIGDSLDDYYACIWNGVIFYAVLTWFTKIDTFRQAGLDLSDIYDNINFLMKIL